MNSVVNIRENPFNLPYPETPKVYAAIAAVINDIGAVGIGKNRMNTQQGQGFAFRGIDDVYNSMNPLLAKHGLCILPRIVKREVTDRASKSGGALFCVALSMEFDLVCSADGSKHTIAVCGEAMDSGDKATNKAMSAAFKYAMMQTFCIPVQGTPDADEETHQVAMREVPEECWVFLKDTATEGETALKSAWQSLRQETRDLILSNYADRWNAIKTTAKGVKS
jgi:hypothetical protein